MLATPWRWACVVTLYGFSREPHDEDAQQPDPATADDRGPDQGDATSGPRHTGHSTFADFLPTDSRSADSDSSSTPRRASGAPAHDAARPEWSAATPESFAVTRRELSGLDAASTDATGWVLGAPTPPGPSVLGAGHQWGQPSPKAPQLNHGNTSDAEEPVPEARVGPAAQGRLGWPGSRARPWVLVAAATAAVLLVGVIVAIGRSAAGGGDRQAAWQAGAAPAVSPSPAVTADATTVTLSGVGDVIMGTAPGDLPPRAGEGFFGEVVDALDSDLVMGNLETPLTEDTGRVKCGFVTPPATPGNPSPKPTRVSGCHQFYLPPSYAQHLRDGGFDLVSLANNHTHDMGMEGLRNTRAALDAAGVKHTGAPDQITYIDVKGVKVAVLGFAIYSWGQNLNNIPAAEQLVNKAAAEADIVVIQMQGGAEGSDESHQPRGREFFLGEDRGDLRRFSRAVIDAGADVIFGHGPHIMRGMEFYKGRLIAYSLGNFCGYGVLNSSGYLGVGGVLKVTLNKDGTWVSGQLVATEMVRGGIPAPDPDRRAIPFVNRLSREDFGGGAARLAADGTITPPSAG